MLDNYGDVLTIEELAEIFKVNRKTVLYILDDLSYRRLGRAYRISKASVIEYLNGKDSHAAD